MHIPAVTVYDMDESGLVTIDGKTVRLRSMKFGGEDCEILDIVPSGNHYHFNNDAREFACCGRLVKSEAVLIVTDKKYVVPCYDCEGWSTWVKNNGHGMDMEKHMTWRPRDE